MYQRITQSGEIVEWNPDDKTRAVKAMENVDGTTVPDIEAVPDNAPVILSNEIARKVRKEYERLGKQ